MHGYGHGHGHRYEYGYNTVTWAIFENYNIIRYIGHVVTPLRLGYNINTTRV